MNKLRYLTVFSPKGWQVIDTKEECKVVASGTLDEMNAKCDELNKKRQK